MRRRQQFARRLAPQHILPVGRDKLIGRIGLATLELAYLKRGLEIFDALRQIGFELLRFEAVALRDLLCAGKLLLAIVGSRLAHGPSLPI